MSNEEFNELLRRMPEIAKSVNAFTSEEIQKQAYDALIQAFQAEQAEKGEAETSAGTTAKPKQKPAKDAAPKGVQDMLAMARANKPVSKAQGSSTNGNGKKKAATKAPAASTTTKPLKEVPAGNGKMGKPSPVEVFKETSQNLLGDIPEELVDKTDHFGKGSIQLLKHHGTYQQDDRETRKKMKAEGKRGKAFMFMVRSKIPGGKLTSEQLLAQIDLGDELADNTLRITSRQGLQFHGIVKKDLKKSIQRINEIQMSTLGACGDVNRNVMCCPGAYTDAAHLETQALADELASHLAPRTRAYHEVWLKDMETGEKELVGGGTEGKVIEPIYGDVYLPRKFKIGIAFPFDNCIDVYTHDVGLLAIVEKEKITGYNIIVGGGQGNSPGVESTFPALGQKMTFVTPDKVLDVVTAIVKVQRDFGNRNNRKQARMKYLIHEWGLKKFKAKVEEYYGKKLPRPTRHDVTGVNDHMGWEDQGNGKVSYGLNVENGRIKDDGDFKLKTAIREICKKYNPGIRLTAHQSIIFTDLDPAQKDEFEKLLKSHGVKLSSEISNARRWSMACVAWPTCGLSITESERALPGVIDKIEEDIARLGLTSEEFTIRMTGCPNGCARPYNSDVGLVGKAAGKYTLYLGGRLNGDRLSYIYKDLVPAEDVAPELASVLTYFKSGRKKDESFGDFCHRKGKEDLLAWTAENAKA